MLSYRQPRQSDNRWCGATKVPHHPSKHFMKESHMTIYTPQELADEMQRRLADGSYKADEELLVTIWCAEDAGQFSHYSDPVTVEEWNAFLYDARHHLSDQIEEAAGEILSVWWTTHEPDPDDDEQTAADEDDFEGLE